MSCSELEAGFCRQETKVYPDQVVCVFVGLPYALFVSVYSDWLRQV